MSVESFTLNDEGKLFSTPGYWGNLLQRIYLFIFYFMAVAPYTPFCEICFHSLFSLLFIDFGYQSPVNKRKMDAQLTLKASNECCPQDLAMKRRRLEAICKRVGKRLISTSICSNEQHCSSINNVSIFHTNQLK